MTFEEFQKTGQACTKSAEWVLQNIGNTEPRAISVIEYDEGCWIECVPDGTYYVICGNADLATADLEEAERFLYDNWYNC